MKIKKLDIASFGALKDMSLVFTDGFNVIYGKNESGKTTVSAFIEAMLFGYRGRDGERKKYIPKSAACSSGSVTLEHGGSSVTIYRTLAASSKEDSFKTFPENAALTFLPESRDTYRRSVYTQESRACDFASTSEIEKKLSNIISSGDENLSASRALERLEKARRTLRPLRGSSGKIARTEAALTLLENERSASLASKRAAENAEKTISEKEQLLSELCAKQDEYKSLNSEIISLKAELGSVDASIKAQEEYVSSFPEPVGKYPAPPKLFSVRLLPYIICSLVLFIIGFTLLPRFGLLFLLPIAVFLFEYLFLSAKALFARKRFLKNAGCVSLDEYKKMSSDRDEAYSYLRSLRRKHEKLIAAYSGLISKSGALEEIRDRIIKTKEEISLLKASLLSDKSRPLDEIDSEIAYYRSERHSLIRKAEALDRAMEAIEYARGRLSLDFTPRITERAQKYISLIAPKENRRFHLDTDLSVSVTDSLPMDLSSCSFGLRQEIYICFRIALCDVIFGDGMPLIFDDPFIGSDDFREKALIDLFASVAEKRQVIILTNRKNSYFAQLDCNYIDISAENDV